MTGSPGLGTGLERFFERRLGDRTRVDSVCDFEKVLPGQLCPSAGVRVRARPIRKERKLDASTLRAWAVASLACDEARVSVLIAIAKRTRDHSYLHHVSHGQGSS